VKEPLVAPARIDRDGSVKVALPVNDTDSPPNGAAALSVAMQFVEPGVVIVDGVHVTEVSVGDPLPEKPVIVPPVPVNDIPPPLASDAKVLLTPIDVLLTPEAIVTFTVAATPLAIVFAFMPVARQVYVPEPETQVSVLPAAVAAAPAVAEIDVTAEGEYVNAHCTPAGWLPAGAANVKLSVTAPFDPAVPEDRTKEPVCPNNGYADRKTSNISNTVGNESLAAGV
jgi:hypothetical protein